jgi:putative heme-binding domain-containing protein
MREDCKAYNRRRIPVQESPMRTHVMLVAIALGALGTLGSAQEMPARNPLEGDAAAIRTGMGLFRGRCAECHGMDARGVRGPDITQVWTSGRTDPGLNRTIREGIRGTEMPANPRVTVNEAWQILAYLRTLAATSPVGPATGNAENGQKLYHSMCASCHRTNGTGGRLGPDLSRIGVSRSREMLVNRIRGAVEGFLPGYEPVTLSPESGTPIVGVKKNEDLFSVQIMDVTERIQGYDKSTLRSVQNGVRSAMPRFGTDRLSESDLNDLIAYLQTFRGFNPAVAQ